MILNSLRRNQSGITLIEVLVASSILIVGIVAALILAMYSLRVAEVSKQELIATNLAREGVEVVRNIRDSNWLDQSDPDWTSGLVGTGTTSYFVPVFNPLTGSWTLSEISFAESQDCESSTTTVLCRIVWSNNGSGFDRMYLQFNPAGIYSPNDILPYSRYIVIDYNSSLSEDLLNVTAKVFYKGFNRSETNFSHSIEIQEELTNWQE